MTYSEKLRDPRWQKKRLEIMNRDDFRCQACQSKEKTLNVHHRFYRKGKAPWEYENSELVTFCEDCHQKVEDSIRSVAEGCAFNETLLKIMYYLQSYSNITEYWMMSQWIDSKVKFQDDPSVSNYNDLQSSAIQVISRVTGCLHKSASDIVFNEEDGE